MSVTVLKAGLQTTIQSRPRLGMRHLGVPASGAADPLSLALANRLVGNAWNVPALEATLLGPAFRFEQACAFAMVGAHAEATLNGVRIAQHETLFAEAGDQLVTGAAERGARFYIAVAGGFVAEDILGSSSTCLSAHFGGFSGRALEEGDELQIRPAEAAKIRTPAEFRPPMSSSWALRTCTSFDIDQLDANDHERLFNENWIVSRRADRMGLELEGVKLQVGSDGRMPSAAVFPGTVQCPESGSPFVLGVDAATIGGYPRVAQVARADRHLLGQLRPGDHVRFLMRSADAAAGELHAKLDYWRAWIPAISEVI